MSPWTTEKISAYISASEEATTKFLLSKYYEQQ
jgi:hypothetical protein